MNAEPAPSRPPELFETKLAQLEDEGTLQGCSSGELNPSKLAAELLTTHEWSGPWLACYMLRRFGWPNIGSDDYKELMSWALTTPMEGLYLTVTPYMGRDQQLLRNGQASGVDALHFGYLHTEPVGKRMSFWAPACRATMAARASRVNEWWKTTGHLKFVWAGCRKEEGQQCVMETVERNEVTWGLYVRTAELEQHLETNEGTEASRAEYLKSDLRADQLHMLTQDLSLAISNPDLLDDDPLLPAKIGLDTTDWPETDREQQTRETDEHRRTVLEPMNDALRAALKDLLRPVFVRDVGFNALGRYKGEWISHDSDPEDFPPGVYESAPLSAVPFAGAGYTPQCWYEMEKEQAAKQQA